MANYLSEYLRYFCNKIINFQEKLLTWSILQVVKCICRKGVGILTIKEVSEKYNITADTLRYYERIGMIPHVSRSSGGIRNYNDDDLGWVELAVCMRNAGLPVEAMTEYVKLCQEGDPTIPARLQLLTEQREALLEKKRKIDATLSRLEYKISRYEIAVETGVLSWDDDKCKTDKNKTEE